MSLKENLKAKIKLDRLLGSLLSTIREPPHRRWLDKELTRELLGMTDFVHRKARNLHLYTRPLKGEIMEVVVLDNELAIYHTTVDDVVLRKSPYWQQMFSIGNVRKIMNDQDVLASKGQASLKRLHAAALALLDLTYAREDLLLLLEDAHRGLEHHAAPMVRESLDLIFELLHFQPLSLGGAERNLLLFGRPMHRENTTSTFEHLVLLDEEGLSLGMKRGPFSPERDADLAWVVQYVRGAGNADLQGMAVFEFLAELALKNGSG